MPKNKPFVVLVSALALGSMVATPVAAVAAAPPSSVTQPATASMLTPASVTTLTTAKKATTKTYWAKKKAALRTSAKTSKKPYKTVAVGTYLGKVYKTKGKYRQVKVSGKLSWVYASNIKTGPAQKSVSSKTAYKAKKKTVLRKAPGSSYAKVKTVKSGASLGRIYKSAGNWRLVKVGGKKGWVAASHIKVYKKAINSSPAAPTTTKYYIATANVNMRASASTSAAILLTVPAGSAVSSPAAKSGVWWKVTYGGKTGWVHSDYIAVTSSKPSAVPAVFTISGSGFGHGIGMSQYGAYQMAREGKSAAAILKHYYTGTAVSDKTTPSDIAVQVYGPEPYSFKGYADTKSSTTFSINTGKWVLLNSAKKQVAAGTKSDKITLTGSGSTAKAAVNYASKTDKTYSSSKFYLRWSGTRFYDAKGTKAVASVSGAQGKYRNGQLEASSIKGKINVVNNVRLNTEYLYGIAEMPSSWGANKGNAALQAQAITARGYAMLKSGSRKAACDCHIVDDVRDQNYTGWNKEGEGSNAYYGNLWKKAVDATVTSATKARVMTYQGKPVQAYYYSSSGGRTANSEDVWASKLPYNRSVADPYSLSAPGNSMKSWTRTISQSTAKKVFGLSDVKKIQVTAKYSSGQAKTIKATSSTGATKTLTYKADAWRSKLGVSLPATWIKSIS